MTRAQLIEQIIRQIYGGFSPEDATITTPLVNQYLDQGLALAAKKNYADNFQLDGVAYVNNSFYSTFKGLTITNDEQFLYKFTLPSIPLGIGAVDGISRLVFKDSGGNISYPVILLSQNQVGVQRSMRPIPNKTLCYPEGIYCYIITTLRMSDYTAMVTMVSGGDSTDLNSIINIPNDYVPVLTEYIKSQLLFERQQPVPATNDGQDAIVTN